MDGSKATASSVLSVLKNKLAQSKADSEKYQEETEELREKLTAEKAKVDQAELEARSLERRIQLLEDNLRYENVLIVKYTCRSIKRNIL